MVELKGRILTSLSKLSDRDTYQIAVEDLEKTIQTLSPETIPMILNCLYEASNDPKPAVKKESLRLLTVVCATHSDSASTHLTKIIACVVKRLKDGDSDVRDTCRDVGREWRLKGILSSRIEEYTVNESGSFRCDVEDPLRPSASPYAVFG